MTMLSENRAAPRKAARPWNTRRPIGQKRPLEAEGCLDHTRPAPAGGASGIVKGFGFDLLADDIILDQ